VIPVGCGVERVGVGSLLTMWGLVVLLLSRETDSSTVTHSLKTLSILSSVCGECTV